MKAERILVAQTAFIGDIILAAPLIRALAEIYPDALIDLLTTPAGAAIHAENPHLNQTLAFDKRGRDRSVGALWRLGASLRKNRYQILLCPHRSFRSGLLCALSGAPMRVGYRNTPSGLFMTHTVTREANQHESRRLLDLLAPLGAQPDRFALTSPLEISNAALYEAYRLLESVGIGRNAYVAIAPGSIWATKRWTAEGFAGVINVLEGRRQRVVLLGSPEDKPVERAIAAALGREPVSLIGRSSLPVLVALVSGARALITNDSAPLHLASMNGTPTVAFFGSTVPGFGFGPLAGASRILEPPTPLACRPCGPHGHQACPTGRFECMRTITPESVIEALDQVAPAAPAQQESEASCG